MPRNTRQYNRVSVNDGRQDSNNDDNDNNFDNDEGMETIELASRGSSTGRNGGGRRRLVAPSSYERVTGHDNEGNDIDVERGGAIAGTNDDGGSSRRASSSSLRSSSSSDANAPEALIPITILDFAQQTFPMNVSPHWTVSQLKHEGVAIHRVPVPLQRLVYNGKLLLDDSTLTESGVAKPGAIVHLFPRPRVVIQPDATEGTDDASTTTSPSASSTGGGGGGGGGARVPTIVLDADEAQQRSQILVLGSVEYMEAQNNVKLFSFMLLVISAIELLNLLALALGVPPEDPSSSSSAASSSSLYPTDDIPTYDDAGYQYWNNRHQQNGTDASHHPSSTTGGRVDPNLILYEHWGWPNTIDLIISAAGVYVALLGIQASNDNARRLAKHYMFGTVLVGIGWMLFNYYVTVRIDRAVADQQHDHSSGNTPSDSPTYDPIYNDDSQLYQSALSVMVLPGLVWVLCCLRAAQFHHLLHEAEEEARDRIRSQMEASLPTATASTSEDNSPPTSTTTVTTHSPSSRASGPPLPVVTLV